MKKNIINAILFNLGWFACVTGGDEIALLAGLFIFTIHFIWINEQPQEWLTIFIIVLIGFTIDSIWFYTGIMQNGDQSMLIPFWLIVLWAIFATTINNSLRWFHDHLVLVALLGLFFGPLAYWMGGNLSNVEIKEPLMQSMLYIGLGWMLMLPTFFILSKRVRSL